MVNKLSILFLIALIAPVRLDEALYDNSTALTQPDFLASENVMIGIMFTLSPIAVLLHLSIIYIILFSNKRPKYSNTFYRLIVCTSCILIYWSHFQMYQGMCHALGHCPGGEIGNLIISSIAQLDFFFCMNMDLLIAFNRFSAIVLSSNYEKIFSPTKGLLYIFMFLVISAVECMPTWIYGKKYVGFRRGICLNTPLCTLIYHIYPYIPLYTLIHTYIPQQL